MPRPAKSVNALSKNLTAEDRHVREETETILRGIGNKLKPFEHLTIEQAKIFRYIVAELKSAQIIGNLDIFVLNHCAVAIDRLNNLDRMANEDPKLIFSPDFLKSRKQYTTDFNKCCQELCLSPQSRAKIGLAKLSRKEERRDPLLKVLKGG